MVLTTDSCSLSPQRPQVIGVGRLSQGGDGGLELRCVHPAIAPGDFFQAGDFESLVVLDGADELGRFQERLVGAGVEPGVAAAEEFDVEVAAFEVRTVDAGDFS